MTRDHDGRFAREPISRIGRTEQRTQLQQRQQAVLARVRAQAARLPRGPAQCVLALTLTERKCPAMSIFGDLGDPWVVSSNTATMRLDDGRKIGLWFGDEVVEVSCEGLDGVAFVKATSLEHLLMSNAERVAELTHAFVGEVIVAETGRVLPYRDAVSDAMPRHAAVARRLLVCAAAANGNPSPRARQLLQRAVRAVKPLTQGAAVPISAEQKQELVTLQVKLYNLSAADMGVSTSTMLGNLIGVLLSGDADQQRKALGWT